MQSHYLLKEIESLKTQIAYHEKELDIAMQKDVTFSESKKLLHKNRLLRQMLVWLHEQ